MVPVPPIESTPVTPHASLLRPIALGRITLKTNLLLAPLAGWTDLAFREAVRGLGGIGLAVTEVVSAHALVTGHRRTRALLETSPKDRPLAIQLNARTPDEAAEAARFLHGNGRCDVIDLNLGCPVRKIARKGGGAALGSDADQAARTAEAAALASPLPVTAKLRLGWDARERTAPAVARALGEAGVRMVTIHGRTRAQVFAGAVDREGIAAVVRACPVPVIANGDMLTPADIGSMLRETGAAGVMVGRGVVEDPWLLRDAAAYLSTGVCPPRPPLAERLALIRAHHRGLAAKEGERHGSFRFRKILKTYLRALGAAGPLLEAAVRIGGAADVERVLAEVLAREEELAPPPPGGLVPTPKRPVDHW